MLTHLASYVALPSLRFARPDRGHVDPIVPHDRAEPKTVALVRKGFKDPIDAGVSTESTLRSFESLDSYPTEAGKRFERREW